MGPVLAQHYTVIAPDNRGMGDSSIPANNVYTSEAIASDLKGVLDFLRINQTLVFSHDKGAGFAAALSAQNRNLVRAVGFSEYGLPGFGYEQFWVPQPTWDLYQNWQLAFFAIPDAAEYFIRDREKQMLSWYFFHTSYSGNEAIPDDILNRYTNSISKPGFLRAMMGPFATYTVAADNKFFNQTLRSKPLAMPMLVLGGEASISPVSLMQQIWGSVGTKVTYDVVPKAGHWIADENPNWVSKRLLEFFKPIAGSVPAVDLSWLENKVTLPGAAAEN
ncbi:putative hydrolase [Rhizodiscina lignyota]|uniref:Hydrolase n=1 Tax=Rhizodiscina lignyota TaxID=1504668 RepID=A0A9P4IGQ2_9PEZI|nr:putative hydrolase [Rhizodiscina lignyota]